MFSFAPRVSVLGNIVLEAWWHGCPLVAARAAGPVELITDGVNGSLCDLEMRRLLGPSDNPFARQCRTAAGLRGGGQAACGGLWRASDCALSAIF